MQKFPMLKSVYIAEKAIVDQKSNHLSLISILDEESVLKFPLMAFFNIVIITGFKNTMSKDVKYLYTLELFSNPSGVIPLKTVSGEITINHGQKNNQWIVSINGMPVTNKCELHLAMKINGVEFIKDRKIITWVDLKSRNNE